MITEENRAVFHSAVVSLALCRVERDTMDRPKNESSSSAMTCKSCEFVAPRACRTQMRREKVFDTATLPCAGTHGIGSASWKTAGFSPVGVSIRSILTAGAINGRTKIKNRGTSKRTHPDCVARAAIRIRTISRRPNGQRQSQRVTRLTSDFAPPSVIGAAFD